MLCLGCDVPSLAENFLSLYGGYQFSASGSNVSAQENLNYPNPATNLLPVATSDLDLNGSFTLGLRAGRYFEALPGFGLEVEGQYSRPDFKRQDVDITLTNASIAGHSTFTMDQLNARFHMLMGGVNLLYRYDGLQKIKPYVGAGPAAYALYIRGSGDSGNIIAPAAIATNAFTDGGDMNSFGYGFGFNAKAGLEIPISERWSFDTEYKFSYSKLHVNAFRSLSDIDVDYRAHNITAGLRFKF